MSEREWYKKATLRISIPVMLSQEEIDRIFPEGTEIQVGSARYQIYAAYMLDSEKPCLKLNCGDEIPHLPKALSIEFEPAFKVNEEDS